MNYTTLILGIVLGFLVDFILMFISIKRNLRLKAGRFRIHHSIYGIIFIILGFFVYRNFLSGLGFGLILSHTVRLKKLIFIEKLKRK